MALLVLALAGVGAAYALTREDARLVTARVTTVEVTRASLPPGSTRSTARKAKPKPVEMPRVIDQSDAEMGIGISLILVAGGAILAWAVHTSPTGVEVNTISVLLLVVGIVGLLLSLVFWSSWAGPGYFRRRYAATRPTDAPPDAYPRYPQQRATYEEIEEERY